MDYYNVLGVSKTATVDEVKKAYRKLAHQHHPDKGGDEKKFKEINEAYQVLSNKEKRAQYDRFGRTFNGSQSGPGGFGFDFNQAQGFTRGFNGFGDLGDIFEQFFGGGAGSQKRDLRKGSDIQVQVELSLEDTLQDLEREIVLEKYVSCSRCGGRGAEPGTFVKECFSCRGTGQVQQVKRTIFGTVTRYIICPECGGVGSKPEKPCNVCNGEGRIKEKEKIKVRIPSGMDSGQVLEMPGKGEAGKKGGESGNLYLRIFVKRHPVFTRKGDDLLLRKDIAFSQAGLGDEIEIPTLEGKDILLNIPSGTQSGKVFRISKKGIPHFGGLGRGSLYVEITVKIPSRLNRKQKELLEKLKEEGV